MRRDAPQTGGGGTSLDPPETNQHHRHAPHDMGREVVQDCGVSFRHAGWQRHRTAIYHAMQAAGFSSARLTRFAECGCGAWVETAIGDPERVRLRAAYCHDRFCLPCQHARSLRLAGRLSAAAHTLAAIAKRDDDDVRLRFVTLTLRHVADPLATQIRHLFDAFRLLRRATWWKQRVRGGVAVLEVKRSKDGKAWHPHLHVLVASTFIGQGWLAEAWHRCTGTSYIVDVRSVKRASQVVNYLTSYMSKPMSYAPTRQPEALRESLEALRAVHTWFTFGVLRGVKEDDEDETLVDWQPVGSLADLLARRRRGDPAADRLLSILEARLPWNQATRDPP